MSDSLFGPSIPEVVDLCKVAFDTHHGSVNVVYFDEHGVARNASPDITPHFIHTIQAWFKYFSGRNKTPTLKIETAQGKGFVIAIVPVEQHKTKNNWFEYYMEVAGWRNSSNEYWKNGIKFIPKDAKVDVILNAGSVNESVITFTAPKDELQVNVMLELIKQ